MADWPALYVVTMARSPLKRRLDPALPPQGMSLECLGKIAGSSPVSRLTMFWSTVTRPPPASADSLLTTVGFDGVDRSRMTTSWDLPRSPVTPYPYVLTSPPGSVFFTIVRLSRTASDVVPATNDGPIVRIEKSACTIRFFDASIRPLNVIVYW